MELFGYTHLDDRFFPTISICTCQETFYIFMDYQYLYIAHYSFTIFLEKEALGDFLSLQ